MPKRVKAVPRLEEKQFASELGEQGRSAETTAPLGTNFERTQLIWETQVM
jgi:hypothetical protein